MHAAYLCDTSVPEATWAKLKPHITNEAVFLPGQAGYNSTVRQYATLNHTKPLAAVHCTHIIDVVTAVKFARNVGACVSVKSSGHSYAATSVQTGYLALDISGLNSTSYDPSSKTMTVGPGTSLISLVHAAEAANAYTVWGGCPTVALGGYVTGGGEGFANPMLGMMVDNVKAYTVVAADGKVLNADDQENSDLYWALRGGGGPGPNFGIVVQAQIQMYDPPTVVSVAISVPGADAMPFSQTFFTEAKSWAPQVSLGISWLPGSVDTSASGWFFGTQAEAQQVLAPLIKFPGARVTMNQTDVFTASYAYFDEWVDIPHSYWVGHSRHSHALTKNGISTLVETLREAPVPAQAAASGVYFFKMGGYVDNIANNATAYAGRGYLGDFEMVFAGPDANSRSEVVPYAERLYQLMLPFLSESIYPNLIDLSQSNALQHYYGDNLTRLRSIRQKYDPDMFFQFPQMIE